MAVVKDVSDRTEGRESIGEGAGGGGLEAIGADGLSEPHDS